MILGIDASNIRGGGGVTHLVELLRAADPIAHGFEQVIVWSGQATLNKIEARPWLVKSHQPLLDKSLLHRSFWQRFRLSKLARLANCDVLFVPGGSYAGRFHPIVTMSRNMLPFEWRELKRSGWSWITIKLVLLRLTQTRSFCRADGLIFLTQYAYDVVMSVIKFTLGRTIIIPHGVDERFICEPREQLPIDRYSMDRPFRILYVSSIYAYKHQRSVVEAVMLLRKKELPIVLGLVGPGDGADLQHLRKILRRLDPGGECLRYHGAVPYAELQEWYAQAHLCLFASSCENMPNILLEGMASGLPVACSNRGPMPEVLGNAGVYFNPENPEEMAQAIEKLIESPELRSQMASLSFKRSQNYSWKQCARETFEFLAAIANRLVPESGNK